MPRIARKKSHDSIYHIMCKSISEVKLFAENEDKKKYISIIQHYKELFGFKIYCYCFMDNHVHMLLDANGADISQIMHGINAAYVQYFNPRHNRNGHLFQDRFKSKIITSNKYLISASAYIHNNVTVIPGYEQHPEKYEYSSLGAYLGLRADPNSLIDYAFVLSLLGDRLKQARERYYELVFKSDSKQNKEIEFTEEGSLYVSQRIVPEKRTESKDVISYVCKISNTTSELMFSKYNRASTRDRALLVVLLKNLCNMNSTQICSVIGNITQANVSRLVRKGIELMKGDKKYNSIFEDFFVEGNSSN